MGCSPFLALAKSLSPPYAGFWDMSVQRYGCLFFPTPVFRRELSPGFLPGLDPQPLVSLVTTFSTAT